MICQKCGSNEVEISIMNEGKSPARWLLIFIPIIGWLALIIMTFRKDYKTQTKALCKKCGKNWNIKK